MNVSCTGHRRCRSSLVICPLLPPLPCWCFARTMKDRPSTIVLRDCRTTRAVPAPRGWSVLSAAWCRGLAAAFLGLVSSCTATGSMDIAAGPMCPVAVPIRFAPDGDRSLADLIHSAPDRIHASPDRIQSLADLVDCAPDRARTAADLINPVPERVRSASGRNRYAPDRTGAVAGTWSAFKVQRRWLVPRARAPPCSIVARANGRPAAPEQVKDRSHTEPTTTRPWCSRPTRQTKTAPPHNE